MLGRASLTLAALLLVACGGGGGSLTGASCPVAEQNRFVYQELLGNYLWRDFVDRNANPANFDSPESLLRILRRQDGDTGGVDDRYSFIADQAEFASLLNDGEFIGIGLRFGADAASRVFSLLVIDGGPAADAGLQRGDEIVRVNGQVPTSAGNAGQLTGPNTEGVQVSIEFSRNGGPSQTVVLSKRVVTIDSTQVVRRRSINGLEVGYLLFTNFFAQKSRDELNAAFAQFAAAGGIDELILDLRYNGGGSVDTSTVLASLIAGTDNAGDLLGRAEAPGRPQFEFEQIMGFDGSRGSAAQSASAVAINRVFVLTTRASASASELVINGLAPYTQVVQIGGPTFGKPVGQFGMNFCDKTAALVNFEFKNANGQGGFFDGIPPDCEVADDISQPLDLQGPSGNEAGIQRALDVIAGTATCTSPAVQAKRTAVSALPRYGWDSLQGFD